MLKPTDLTLFLFAIALAAANADAQGRRRGPGGRMGPPPVLNAIDTNGDREISKEELAAAHTALLTLDANGDGNLTSDELAPPRPERSDRGRRRGPPGGMMASMMASHPVVKALDKDGDAELFEDEVTDAATSLAKLDANADGRLAGDEIEMRFGRPPGGRGFGRDHGRAGDTLMPADVKPEDGAATLADRAAFKALAYQGDEVMIDTHLAGLEFVKFQIEGAGDEARMYFINTKTHRAHMMFMSAVGIAQQRGAQMRGVLVYRPMLKSPSGNNGLYTFEFEPEDAYSFEEIVFASDLLCKHAPILAGNLAYHLLPVAKERYVEERAKYDAADFPVFDAADLFADIGYLPLHCAESFGRLRLMELDERPGARDVVLYRTLPNEMPRVAGVITGFRQTPLSHVNLRAVQDDVPNAFIAGAATDPAITRLLGKYVCYRVAADGYELREATAAEVESHFESHRPAVVQIPERDVSVREIRRFADLDFADSKSVGVKAANLATLRKLGFASGMTPDGHAVPFAFYDAFMRHNELYARARAAIATPGFDADAEVRARELKQLRKAIRKAKFPEWARDALAEVQAKFAATASIRCRSSTNNEDLPGFSGAGLYDSVTHHPREGHLAKSIAQVFASLWNFRAFEEREFHRIDHFAAAMGVALHESSKGELANGVAVTKDILYQTAVQGPKLYYVNVQVGEDLVTNPAAESVPDELLLSPRNPRTDRVVRRSNRVADGTAILDAERLRELRRGLRVIQEKFAALYGRSDDPNFAMEIEFKLTADGALLVKQARPWVD